MVTGRAGWMGMGRGAGRSALGFWPILALLLCSFPAGKALLRERPPGGSHLLFPRVFVSPVPGRGEGGGALLGLHCKKAGRGGHLSRRYFFPRKWGPGIRTLGALEEGERGWHGLGTGGTLPGSSPTTVQTCRCLGVDSGPPPRS